jgi:hypothetical protein
MGDDENTRWDEVLAKAAALIALKMTKLEDDSPLDRAVFLEGLGISRNDAAAMIGVTPNVLAVAKHRKAKGGRSGRAQKKH